MDIVCILKTNYIMKKILNLKGVSLLSKTEQSSISGSGGRGFGCHQNGYQCCTWRGGVRLFCDAGTCMSNGRCHFI